MPIPKSYTGAEKLRQILQTDFVRGCTQALQGGATGKAKTAGYVVALASGRHLRITDATRGICEAEIRASEAAYNDLHRPKFLASPIFVYGPRGCGKTRNAKWIAETFGRTFDDVIDEWEPGDKVKPGAIHLTILPPHRADMPHAISVPFARLGQAQDPTLPTFIPYGCGTGHVRAQVMLGYIDRLIATRYMGLDDRLLSRIENLIEEAGIGFAKRKLGPAFRDEDLDDDVPF